MSVYSMLLALQSDWGLTEDQLAALLHKPVPEVQRILRDGPGETEQGTVPRGLESSVPLTGIYVRLRQFLPKAEDQAKWLLTPNSDFGNNKPIDIAASSLENLQWLSYYLSSVAELKAPISTES